jgi:hypothetical protein
MCFARLVTHYWRHAACLRDGILLRQAAKPAGIPALPRPRRAHPSALSSAGAPATPTRPPKTQSHRSRPYGPPAPSWKTRINPWLCNSLRIVSIC